MEPLEESLDDVLPTETAAAGRPSRRLGALDRAVLGAAGLCLLAAPLQFLRVGWMPLFYVQAALNGWGHWVAPALLLGAWASRGLARRLALAAALLALLPAARAYRLAPAAAEQTRLAWGPGPFHDKPFSPGRLYLPAGGGVERSEEAFDEAHGLAMSLWSSRDDQGLMTQRPVVLLLHGGGWHGGRRDEVPAFSARLARLGWVVADMDYRLAPANRWPAQREDLLRALEFLRLNARRLRVDPLHVVLMGRSAGAHLALAFGYGAPDPAVRGVIAFYGPADLHYAWEHGDPGDILDSPRLLSQLCGGGPKKAKACYDDASPILHVGPDTPPTLLVHGSLDTLVVKEQSRRLDAVLRRQGIPHQLLELPWAVHALDRPAQGPGGQLAFYAVERFLAATEESPSHLLGR